MQFNKQELKSLRYHLRNSMMASLISDENNAGTQLGSAAHLLIKIDQIMKEVSNETEENNAKTNTETTAATENTSGAGSSAGPCSE